MSRKSDVKSKLALIFFIVIICSFSMHIIYFFANPTGSQMNIYFQRTGNFFADFYNVVRYSADRNPFYLNDAGDPERAYLPICYLILYPFSRILDMDNMSYLCAIEVVLITTLALIYSLEQLCKRWGVSRKYIVGIFTSGLFMFSIERGNLILVAVPAIVLYLAWYDSDIKWKRVVAAACLALAAALKIYPVIFGCLYLRKRMWKEIIISGLICCFMVLGPFFFFEGGIARMSQMFTNVKISSLNYGNPMNQTDRFGVNYLVFRALTGVFGASADSGLNVAGIISKVVSLIAVLAVLNTLFVEDEYMAIMLMSFAVLFLPANSQLYCGMYLFPGFIIFWSNHRERLRWLDYSLAAFYIAAFIPFRYEGAYKGFAFNNYVVMDIFSVIVMCVLVIRSLIRAKRIVRTIGE